ncbi:MAG: rhodanese-like domain-containing protein [Candidatus Omnitrophota bacterium]
MAKRIIAISMTGIFLWLGGTAAFAAGAETDPDFVSIEELRQLQIQKAPLVVLDARGLYKYEESHIEGAVLPMSAEFYRQDSLFKNRIIAEPPDRQKALSEAMQKFSKDVPIVTYCNRNCQASRVLQQELKLMGFKNVRAMEDGAEGWIEKGYPTVSGL